MTKMMDFFAMFRPNPFDLETFYEVVQCRKFEISESHVNGLKKRNIGRNTRNQPIILMIFLRSVPCAVLSSWSRARSATCFIEVLLKRGQRHKWIGLIKQIKHWWNMVKGHFIHVMPKREAAGRSEVNLLNVKSICIINFICKCKTIICEMYMF